MSTHKDSISQSVACKTQRNIRKSLVLGVADTVPLTPKTGDVLSLYLLIALKHDEDVNRNILSVTRHIAKEVFHRSMGGDRDDSSGIQLVDNTKIFSEVFLWLMVVVGLPANAASVVTAVSMSTSVFFVSLLAAADSLALLFQLGHNQLIKYVGISNAICSLQGAVPVLGCYANWVLALVCFDMFFAVWLPDKKHKFFTIIIAQVCCVILAVVVLLFFIPTFFFSVHFRDLHCVPRKGLKSYLETTWSVALLPSLYLFSPFLLVAVFTLPVLGRLIREKYQHKRQEFSPLTDASGSLRTPCAMFLGTGIAFLGLSFPACLYHLIINDTFQADVGREDVHNYLCFKLVMVMSHSCHALKFFVYVVSAPAFRTRVADTLRQSFACCSCCPGYVGGESPYSAVTYRIDVSRENVQSEATV